MKKKIPKEISEHYRKLGKRSAKARMKKILEKAKLDNKTILVL